MATNKNNGNTIFSEGKHFKLELHSDSQPSMWETSIDFSLPHKLTLDPCKSVQINTDFRLHQKGEHLIHFEMQHYHTSLQLLPQKCSRRVVGPYFRLINHSEFSINLAANSKIFKATFVQLDDVDIYQDVPVGLGVKDMEEHENDLYYLNLVEIKDKKEQEQRNKKVQHAGKVIAEAVKLITDRPKTSSSELADYQHALLNLPSKSLD